MRTINTIRSMAAMMVILFAVTTTSCQKESEVAPNTPAISTKPTLIITEESGNVVRKQIYKYDVQGKLLSYESTGATSDSVLVRENSVAFKSPGSTLVNQVLTFNADKTFKTLFLSVGHIDFINNQTKLRSLTSLTINNTPITLGEFLYSGNNLSAFISDESVSISYNDLPYQKGINEIPGNINFLRFYKIMEMENATSTILYNKLIRKAAIESEDGTITTHDFNYEMDGNSRVTKITDTVTTVSAGATTQKVLTSTITY